jgi:flagellin
MAVGIQTNTGALSALQNLNRTQNELESTQKRVSSGLEVAEAKDDAGSFAVAQSLRADVTALDSVNNSISRATAVGQIALISGEAISDLLNQLREKATAGSDPSLDAESRSAINADFEALKTQIQTILANAEFKGVNLINATTPQGVEVIADAQATRMVTLASQDLTMGGPNFVMPATADLSTPTLAAQSLALVRTSIENVNRSVAQLGADLNKLDAHKVFVSKLMDTLTQGIGSLVDADLAVEAARLQSLQVRQELGVQSLSIANRSPEVILNLFR